jgi:hypothetical protein
VTQDGVRTGVLTQALIHALTGSGDTVPWRSVYDRVFAHVHAQYATQTPQLVGEIDRAVLGGSLAPVPHTVTVLSIDGGGQVTLTAGRAMGVNVGAVFGLHPVGADLTKGPAPVAVATVVSADATTVRATLEPDADLTRIEPGSPALALDLTLQRTVAYERPNGSATAAAALEAVASAVERNSAGLLARWTGGDTPHYVVTLDRAGAFAIQDGGGVAFPGVAPVAVDAPEAATTVAMRLQRLARFHLVHGFEAPRSSLTAAVPVTLLKAPAGFDPEHPGSVNDLGDPVPLVDGAYEVPPATLLFIRVVNTADQPVDVAAVDLQDNWAIVHVAPADGSAYKEVGGRARETFAVAMDVSAGRTEALDVFKVFVTRQHADFRWLTQTAIDAPNAPRTVMRSGDVSPRSALERLFEAIDAPVKAMRGSIPVALGDAAWTVHTFRVRVKR